MIEPMPTEPYDLSAPTLLAKLNEVIELVNKLEEKVDRPLTVINNHYHQLLPTPAPDKRSPLTSEF